MFYVKCCAPCGHLLDFWDKAVYAEAFFDGAFEAWIESYGVSDSHDGIELACVYSHCEILYYRGDAFRYYGIIFCFVVELFP